MALPFDLTEDATSDLEDAAGYLAEESEAVALRLADALEAAFFFIAKNPKVGHRRAEFPGLDELGFWTSAGYVIAYLADRSPILILGVVHGSRDAEAILPTRIERLGTE